MAEEILGEGLRPVPGYEGRYNVDASGNLYSVARTFVDSTGRRQVVRARKRSTRPGTIGYVLVFLSHESRGKRCEPLHRLVCHAFHGGPIGDRRYVNHKNGIRHDNRAENLEWCTHSENMIHAFRELGAPTAFKGKFGKDNPGSTPIVGINSQGEIAARFAGLNEARRHGFSAGNISMCISGHRRMHKGLKWQLENQASLHSPATSDGAA